MQCVFVLLAIMATTLAAPQTFRDWAQIKKAQPVHHHVKSDDTLKFQSSEKSWDAFKLKHDKSYDAEEEVHRFRVFLQNMAYIDNHNREYNAGRSSFYVGMNYFGDFEFEEFRVLNGYRGNLSSTAKSSRFMKASYVELPDSVDWREQGYVTAVKNQGRCGSCWSFSATGSLEGQHYKLKRGLVSLSEQQLVDCSAMYGNHGCQGGLMDNAFQYIKAIGGIDSENSYPYVAVVEPQCHFQRSDIKAHCTGFVDIEQGSEADLQHATATVGPISIAIDAGHSSFQFYRGGVYNEPQCSPTKLDHGVLIVGYGTSVEGIDYWIVKNSWGPQWGEQGYINMSRNRQNQCGVATKASYPLV